MDDLLKLLCFLRANGGSTQRVTVSHDLFKYNRSASELDAIQNDGIARGFIIIDSTKRLALTAAGYEYLKTLEPAQEIPLTQPQPVSEAFARFRQLAKQNPDCSPQRLLQLAGRRLGDPLESDWAEWRKSHPEWYLQQPSNWYANDVELDASGYPLRYPANPLTIAEHEDRPKMERTWFEWAMRQPGASLEPLAKEMPAFECANIVRVTRKVGMANAIDIFGQEKIKTAHRLAGLACPFESSQMDSKTAQTNP